MRHIIGTTFCFVSVVWMLTCARPSTAHAQIERQIDQIQQIRMPRGWTEEYHSSLSTDDSQYLLEDQITRVTADDLADWKKSANNDVALRAAWELARLAKCDGFESGDRQFDPVALARFLGFLEGYLRVKPPDWWEQAFQLSENSGAQRHDRFMYDVSSEQYRWDCPKGLLRGPVGNSHYECFGGTCVRLSGRDLIAAVDDRESTIRDGLQLIKELGDNDSLSLVVEGDRAFIANFDDRWPHSYRLACAHRFTGRMLWTAEVWALRGPLSMGGLLIPRHWADIVANGSRVAVFGADPTGMYAEVFDLETGACLGRFCTAYVYHRE